MKRNNLKKANCTYIGDAVVDTLNENTHLKIHSVFSRSMNLWYKNKLILLSKDTRFAHPYSIILCEDEEIPKLKCGNYVQLDINIDKRKEYSTSFVEYRIKAPSDLTATLKLLHILLEKNTGSYQHLKEVYPHVMYFQKVFLNRNFKLLNQAVVNLVGNGGGLTPTGDDILVGILGLFYAYKYLGYGDYSSILKSVLSNKGMLTNTISWQYIRHGINDCFLFLLLKFCLMVLTNNDKDVIESKLKELLGIGHTSGFDLTVGVIVGINILIKMNRRKEYYK